MPHIQLRRFFSCLVFVVAAFATTVSPRNASAVWPQFGRAACDDPAIQQRPVITSDGAGGAIIAWEDLRTSPSLIAAQHLFASGELDAAWPHFGRALMAVPLVNPVGGQANAALVPDLTGGAIVVWEDGRSGTTGLDIYAQHVLANGTVDPAWPATGTPVVAVDGVQERPIIVSDAAGGAIVAWMDGRPGASVVDIYAQRVLASGLVDATWPANGLAVSTASEAQAFPVITGDGDGGALIAWYDLRDAVTNGSDIYAQHVLVSGVVDPAWPANGRAVCTAVDAQVDPAIVTDDSGQAGSTRGAVIAWCDSRNGVSHVFAQHVLASGAIDPAWPANGRALSSSALVESRPIAVADGAGGAVVTWQRLVSPFERLFAQHVTAAGDLDPAWPSNGRALISSNKEQENAQVAQDGSGGAIVTWDNGNDVFAQHVLLSGTLDAAYPNDGRVLCDLDLQQAFPMIVATDDAGAIVTWLDDRTGTPDIYALQVMNAGPTGVPDHAPPAIAFTPAYPNPARGSLTLRFVLPAEATVRLTIYDVAGRRVRELVAGRRPSGDNMIGWNMRDERGREVSAGVYFARLEVGSAAVAQKLVKVQ